MPCLRFDSETLGVASVCILTREDLNGCFACPVEPKVIVSLVCAIAKPPAKNAMSSRIEALM